MWSPNGKSQGHIFRLDPDGDNAFTRHEETVLADLIADYLPGAQAIYVLAAYNDFISVTDPTTGKAKQMVGFEAIITGDHPKWETFYKGAMYAIRDENQNYTVTEVNGRSDTEKPALVAPRAYALSPFDDCDNKQVIFFGGHDANFRPSKDMAWIYSTALENALDVMSP